MNSSFEPDTRAARIWPWVWYTTLILLMVYLREGDDRFPIPNFQYLFLLLCLGVMIDCRTGWKSFRAAALERAHWPLYLLLVLFVMSAARGLDPYYGLRLIFIMTVTSAPFWMIGRQLGTFGMPVIARASVMASVAIAVAACAFDWFGPVELGGFIFENHYQFEGLDKDWRWTFFFNEAPGLGYVMALGISGALFAIATAETLRRRIGIGLSIVLMTYVLLMTNSRAAILWAGFALLSYGSYYTFRWVAAGASRVAVTVLAIGVLAIAASLTINYWESISVYLRIDQYRRDHLPGGATSFRFGIWLVYWDKFLANPLLGFGFGATDQLAANLPGSGPANVYIGLLGEAGLPALVIVLGVWGRAVVSCIAEFRRHWREHSMRGSIALWLGVMFLGFALQQLGEWSLFHVSPLHYLFTVLFAAVLQGFPPDDRSAQRSDPAPLPESRD